MHHVVVVNARAGTVLEAGRDAFAARIVAAFEAHGSSADVKLVHPRELDDALSLAIEDQDCMPVIAGGGRNAERRSSRLAASGQAGRCPAVGDRQVLGRDLGLAGSLEDQIAALCNGAPVFWTSAASTTSFSTRSRAWVSSV